MKGIHIDTSNKTLKLIISALMIAIGTVLSLIKFQGFWIYGGSVTLCAMLPLVIVSYIYGVKWGLLTAFVYSLIQMLLGFSNVMYGSTFLMMIAIALLDYVVAYTVVGLAGIFKNKVKNPYIGIACGVVLALFLRFICHFISGWAIWDALWPNDYGMISPLYSLVYNGSYMLPETIITTIIAIIINRFLHFTEIGKTSA